MQPYTHAYIKAQASNRDGHPDKNEKVKTFSEWFSSVVRKLKTKAMSLLDFIWKTPNDMKLRTEASLEFKYVSRVFVLKQLKALKRKKATALDNLSSALLKDCADVIVGPLSHLIKLSLKTGTVPLIWKKARITPLHKSSSTTTPENYRPISVLPILFKTLEKSVHEQFYNFFEKENLISNRQFGYKKKRSTELASTIL